MRRKRNRRALLLTAIVAMIVATGAYAYTNSIGSVTPPNLGASAPAAINGYTAGTIAYTLDATTPTNLDSVSFPLTGATVGQTVVQIQLASGGSWYPCTVAAGPVVTCTTTSPQATAAGATQLTIVAQK